MLLNRFSRPLRLVRKPSRYLQYYLWLVHVLAIVAILLSDINMVVKSSLLCFLFGSLFYFLKFYLPESHSDGKEWVWLKDNIWIEEVKLSVRYWKMRDNYVVTPWFVVLTFEDTGGQISRHLIVKDQLTADEFRRLCVRLKYYQGVAIRIDETAL